MFSRIIQIFQSLSKIERLLFYGAMAVFVISGLILGAEAIDHYTETKPTSGGLYTEGAIGQPGIINPVLGTSEVDRELIQLIFTNLSNLADSIKNEDNRIWTIRLKDNARWHDGEKITSDDVVFTILMIQNTNTLSPLFNTWQGVIAERVSEKEIKLTIRTPYVFFEDNLKDLFIIPRHIFTNIPPSNLRLSDYILEAVGSGPYKFESFQKRKDGLITKYTIKANNDYFERPPYIEKIEFRFYSTGEELIHAYNNGEIDGFGISDPGLLQNISRNHTVNSITLPQYYAIFLNQNSSLPLKEKNVRLALDLLIDRRNIIKETLQDEAIEITGPLVPGSTGYNAKVNTKKEFDPEKVEDILDSSGWKVDKDGIRSKVINGTNIKLEFNLVVPDISILVNVARIVKENFGLSGIRLNLDVLNTESINRDIIPTRNYQMILFGNITGRQPDLFSFWHSSQRFYPGLNLSLYQNKSADNLIESIRQNANEEKRQSDLSSLQSLIIQDQPVLFLYAPKYIYITEPKLKGFDKTWLLTPAHKFDNVEHWYLKTTRVLK